MPNRITVVATLGLLIAALTPIRGHATEFVSSSIDMTHPEVTRELSAQAALPPPHGLTRPGAPAAPLRLTANGPQREVFGFVQAAVVADSAVGYPSWDFSMLTTVAFFGEHVNWDGNLVQGDTGWAVWNSSTTTGLINAAHAHGVKVVLTLILIDGEGNQAMMCSGLGWGDRTISQGIQQMQALGADGINLDYEGENTGCVDGQSSQAKLINFVQRFHAAMPAGAYLSMDSYSGSGEGPDGFFNLPALAPYVDSFFVMAYDMEYYNWAGPPANCSQMCLGPTSPLTTYYYNDTRTVSEYTATIPASKVILGLPYYGRKACVGPGVANAYPTSAIVGETYLDASGEAAYVDTVPGTYSIHRDPNDPIGQERFDDWQSSQYSCTRQLYWDDFASLGAKYDLVNRYNLRGVGIFTLNYGGGAPELWCDLRDHFSPGYVPATLSTAATQATTQFTLTVTAGQGCGVSAFDIQVQDPAADQPWLDLADQVAPTAYTNQAYSATLTANGYRGHTYNFRVRTHDGRGNIGAWSPPVSSAVLGSAAASHPFQGMYTLDVFGGISSDGSALVTTTAYWNNWRIARAAHAFPGPNAPQGGLVLDGYGGLHLYGSGLTSVDTSDYWPGWDIARDFAFLPNGTGGYVLDGYGGLHGFSLNATPGGRARAPLGLNAPPPVQGEAYWPGWDIARKVVILPNGLGGYVLDGYGGIHAFGIGRPKPPDPVLTDYWPGWDIARDMVLIPGTQSGYVLDGYGGVHQFAPPGQPMPPPLSGTYWQGWDIARGVWLVPSSTLSQPMGYVVDGYGGLHGLGGAPAVAPAPYWPGNDVTRMIWGA